MFIYSKRQIDIRHIHTHPHSLVDHIMQYSAVHYHTHTSTLACTVETRVKQHYRCFQSVVPVILLTTSTLALRPWDAVEGQSVLRDEMPLAVWCLCVYQCVYHL